MTIIKRILQLLTCILLFVAVAINRDGRVFGYGIHDSVSQAAVQDVDERISDDGSRIVSTLGLAGDIYGFGGNVPLEIYISSGRIDSVKPLANSESPEFFSKVIGSGLLDEWNGMTPEEAVGKNVDAVTGATMSSTAVIESMKRGLAYASDTKVKSSVQFPADIRSLCVIVVLLAGMLIPFFFKDKRYRYLQLILNVTVLGLWSGSFLSLSALVNLCSNGVVLNQSWMIVSLMVVAAFIYPFFGKSGHYCAWVCPLGSCQELVGKCVPYKIKLAPKMIEALTSLREALWLIIMAIMWLGAGFRMMDYELFTAFMFQHMSFPLLVAALVVIVLSGVVQRPYCRFVCPTGSTIKFSQQIK